MPMVKIQPSNPSDIGSVLDDTKPPESRQDSRLYQRTGVRVLEEESQVRLQVQMPPLPMQGLRLKFVVHE